MFYVNMFKNYFTWGFDKKKKIYLSSVYFMFMFCILRLKKVLKIIGNLTTA